MAPTSAPPTFQFEENRLVHSLRLLAYPADTFTSEEACRCAFAVTAARRGERTPPPHETNVEEWGRVLGMLLSVEPKAWVESAWTKLETEARIEEASSRERKERRSTQL